MAQIKIAICHATSSKTNPFVAQEPNADGVLSAHAHHPDDIIPPFVVVERGKTIVYPGKNLDAHYGAGYTGVELLANGCRLPTGAVDVTTVPEAIIEPPRTVTVPERTTTETILETFVVPAEARTAPDVTTVVTVPANSEATVTFADRTITLPAATETIDGETIVRPPETVTLPEAIETETAGSASTVVTVTGPDEVVEDSTTATTQAVITVPARREVTTEAAHTIDLHRHKPKGETVVETVPRTLMLLEKTITVHGTKTTETIVETLSEPTATEMAPGTSTVVTLDGGASVTKKAAVTVTTPNRVVRERARATQGEETKVVAVVIHATGCPTGTALFDGSCAPIARGKG